MSMPAGWRQAMRRLRRLAGWTLLTLVMSAALLVALASQLLPLAARYPDAVAGWLSERIGAPVMISGLEARWNRAGPELALSGLRIGALPEVLDVGRAQLQVNVYSGLWPGMPLTELRLAGLDLELRRNADGRWQLDGFGESTPSGKDRSQFDQLERFGAVDVRGARLRFRDEIRELSFDLPRIDARLQRSGGRLHFGALLHAAGHARLRLAGHLTRDGQSGSVYFEGQQQDWVAWAQGVSLHGLELVEAHGDLRAWVDFSAGTPSQVLLEAELAPFVLRRNGGTADMDMAGEHAGADSAGFAALKLSARMQRGAEGIWQAQVPHWQVRDPADGGAGDWIDVLRHAYVSEDAAGLLRAEIDLLSIGPLLKLARLAPPMSDELRRWFSLAKPQGELRTLQLLWRGAGSYSFDAGVNALGWSPALGVPALSGVSGRLDGDANAGRLRVDSGVWDMRAPDMLRTPFEPQASGELLIYRSADGLHVETPGLHLYEDSYDILLAGGLMIPEDEDGVLLDLRADVAEAPIVVAKRFWPINVMPSAAVEWLDAALLDGRVRHGAALVRGNVKDWPFVDDTGRFEAYADLADAQLLFHEDWQPGHGVSGIARFINAGMEVDLSGRIGDAAVEHARGGISDFSDAVLKLDVEGSGTGAALLQVLRQSPLQASYGEYMRGLSLGGEGTVRLDLQIPLEEHHDEPRIDGHVDIARMDMHDSTWDLDFSSASGRVRFSERGFSANELNVGFHGGLAALSIAVGDYTSSKEQLVEASLRGSFPAAQLLAASPRSEWLKPWFDGESDWNLQLSVPDTDDDSPAEPSLRVRSDLIGTAISLPAPLRKAAEEALPLDLSLGLPWESSRMDLRLGRLLHLSGHGDDTGGFTGLAMFGASTGAPMPERGLHVGGQIPVLDLAAWGGVAGDSDDESSFTLASVDIFAGELNLLGRRFRETRLTVRHDDSRYEIGFDGEALAGRLLVPTSGLAQKGITGQFARLHWPEVPEAADDETEAETVDKTGGDAELKLVFPSAIPPLHLESEETSFAGAELGSLWLETYPTANGMHVERLDTHSPALDIKAKGDWLFDGAGERSALSLDFSSRDAGGMLGALGFSRLIDGGSTHGQLRLNWSGAPGDFDWGGADGELSVSIGQGRVLEVEPGAGRLFGLLSLTEIPRRLMLDFSDFFKSGLAFNQMAGSFTIEKGNAVTDGFRIDAPSTTILLRGRTGLQARDYDQTLEVLPKAGSVLPAIGAIAAGPAGAAVGAVAQAMLRQPLKDATRIVYQVTGPWDDPTIELLEREVHGN